MTLITSNDAELFKVKLSEPKILISPPSPLTQTNSNSSVPEFDNLEEENEFNQLFMLQDDDDFENKIDNQENSEPPFLYDNLNGTFNNNNSGNLQNNIENEEKKNPQSLISSKTINFIKKYFSEREDKESFEEYNYETNNEVNIIEEFEKTISI